MHAETATHGVNLVPVVALLAAAIVLVPIFRRLGLGSVLGYLAGGVLIGPFGTALVTDAHAILNTAELGVVLFLFVVGLEMEPQKLWGLRKQIFGLGVVQVVGCIAVLTVVGKFALSLSWLVSFVASAGFVLTSTAIVMQVLSERAETGSVSGQKIVSILLLEDLAIVPLLALVALVAPALPHAGDAHGEGGRGWLAPVLALVAIAVVVAAGRYALNPLFRFLANSKAREVMTGAALFVVLGSALVMDLGGLSMAMGAFLAGVLLSTSTFRHQLEADIEPFRGILLGLFFLAVGMSLDLHVVGAEWRTVALGVAALMIAKAAVIYGIARATKSDHREALDRAVMMSQGGEFAFVLYGTALTAGLFAARESAVFTAMVIVSMALTPLALIVLKRLTPAPAVNLDHVERAHDLKGNVLLIGFGRFGQIASQGLLMRKHRVSIIDNDVEMIEAAATFGFKVYYGDGTRLDILHAAGAGHADLVLVATDKREETTRIAKLLRHEFPLVKVFARAFDRAHVLELAKIPVDYQIREMLESALVFGSEALQMLGATPEEASEAISEVRARDRKRLEMQLLGGMRSGQDLLVSNARDAAEEHGVQAASAPSTPVAVSAGEPEQKT